MTIALDLLLDAVKSPTTAQIVQRFVYLFEPLVRGAVETPDELCASHTDVVNYLSEAAADFAAGKDPPWGLKPQRSVDLSDLSDLPDLPANPVRKPPIQRVLELAAKIRRGCDCAHAYRCTNCDNIVQLCQAVEAIEAR